MSSGAWLILSKPLRAPFRDGSTVLVRDLVRHMPGARGLCYLGDPSSPLRPGDAVLRAPPAGYAPTLGDKLRALAALVRRPRLPVHLCFTPGRATARVISALRRLQPRRVFVQSLMSSHGAEGWADLLRPLDAVVALSQFTADRLRGVPAEKIRVIRPAVAAVPVDPPAVVAARRTVLYAGDLDREISARLVALARALPGDWALAIACRPKAEHDAEAREHLRRELADLLARGRVDLRGEVADMDALLRSAALQLYAATHTRNKVDLPLVLLEGLARGVPAAIVEGSPAAELAAIGKSAGLPAALLTPAEPDAFARAVVAACAAAPLADSSAAAGKLAVREFSPEAMARRYDVLYGELERR